MTHSNVQFKENRSQSEKAFLSKTLDPEITAQHFFYLTPQNLFIICQCILSVYFLNVCEVYKVVNKMKLMLDNIVILYMILYEFLLPLLIDIITNLQNTFQNCIFNYLNDTYLKCSTQKLDVSTVKIYLWQPKWQFMGLMVLTKSLFLKLWLC